ncbi:hypothetical protein FVE67_05400 [Thermosulfurimonas marina]|uniref:Glycosyltransferase RgtA/B/C/D-like domain-containing protein n=1 Tax=Thermosulfurimonas marina TaxID=2047767 RepID=A0A6H1WSU7_9BACT|nr:glycosyltransferase family 39 protein [Thermosulfurimonas marina]QJA06273.1 hypothetical protein FVE67_05400 [Thermosulfurimonas marina]
MSKEILKVFLLALFLGLWFQGTRPFMGRDEHRYPQVARTMRSRGEWLVPYWEKHPHLTKPPVIYWMIAAGEKLFGSGPWGARIPHALALAVTAAAIAALGAKLFGEEGFKAGFLYAVTLTPFVAANIVTPDTPLVMWEVLAAWAFFTRPLLAWVFWGLAFMTKGTAVFPVMLPFVWYGWLAKKDLRGLTKGLALFLLVALPWHLYIQMRFPYFWKIFLKEEISGRLLHNYYHRNSAWYAPFYIYLPLLTVGALPGFVWFIRDFKGLRDLWREIHLRVILLWYAVPLTVFWLAKSRLPLYILPLFAPFSLMVVGLRLKRGRALPGPPFWGFWIAGLLVLKAALSWYFKSHGIFPEP